MYAVEVAGIGSAVADKELGTTSIFTGMSHRKNSAIVVLVIAIQFAFDFVPRAANASAFWATTLNNKIWNYPVKGQSIVKAFF
jgi:hypothetical protein